MGRAYFSESRDYAAAVDAEMKCFDRFGSLKHLGFGHSFYDALNRIAHFTQDTYGRELEIIVTFDVVDPRAETAEKLALGTKISPASETNPPEVTHFLCRSRDGVFLTKMHIDYDFEIGSPDSKPSAHIQFGGRVNRRLRAACGCSDDEETPWDQKVNKPRFPTLPMNTALFWHAAFLEYQSVENDQIIEILSSHQWNEIVKESEEIVFRPFLRDGIDILDRIPSQGILRCFYEPADR